MPFHQGRSSARHGIDKGDDAETDDKRITVALRSSVTHLSINDVMELTIGLLVELADLRQTVRKSLSMLVGSALTFVPLSRVRMCRSGIPHHGAVDPLESVLEQCAAVVAK